jgi:hypothetical protein
MRFQHFLDQRLTPRASYGITGSAEKFDNHATGERRQRIRLSEAVDNKANRDDIIADSQRRVRRWN